MSHIWSKEEVRSFKLLLRRITEKYESEEDVKEARAVAKLLIEINADDAEAWYFLGGLNIILGELDEAQKNLFRSLELGGEKLPNYILLANVYANQGKFKEALIWSYKARKCDPKNVFVYRRIADLHVQDGDTVKAIKVLQQLLKIPSIKDNDLYSALVEIGNLCMQTQRMNKALEYFKAAQKINSSDADLLRECKSNCVNGFI
jgi:tetratricopeptide (TPR) repeat protein